MKAKDIRTFKQYKKCEEELFEAGKWKQIYQLRKKIFVKPLESTRNPISKTKLAERLRCNRNTIKKIIDDYYHYLKTEEMGCFSRGRPKRIDVDWEDIEWMYANGKTLGQMSNKHDVPKSTIHDFLVRNAVISSKLDFKRIRRQKLEKKRGIL